MIMLTGCPSPGGNDNSSSTPSPTPTPNKPPPVRKYTTTITGKVVTPARAADPAKGDVIKTAQVWSSIDPETKVSVDPADGSFTITVTHPGTFTLNADYTAPDKNYKTGAPQTVSTTAPAHTRDIPLNYGYTTTLSGIVVALNPGGSGSARNDATVTVTVENRVVDSTTSSGTHADGTPAGNYRITITHPGAFRATASLPGVKDEVFNVARIITQTRVHNFALRP